MKRRNKNIQIISETIKSLKSQLEEKPSDKDIYVLIKQIGKNVYKCDDETFSSVEEFMQIKGADSKRDLILIIRPASEDPDIEHRRKIPTSIH